MEIIEISTAFIKLDQLLKYAGIAGSGSDAKSVILEEMVQVNGEVCTQRGRKIYPGDKVRVEGFSTLAVQGEA